MCIRIPHTILTKSRISNRPPTLSISLLGNTVLRTLPQKCRSIAHLTAKLLQEICCVTKLEILRLMPLRMIMTWIRVRGHLEFSLFSWAARLKLMKYPRHLRNGGTELQKHDYHLQSIISFTMRLLIMNFDARKLEDQIEIRGWNYLTDAVEKTKCRFTDKPSWSSSTITMVFEISNF